MSLLPNSSRACQLLTSAVLAGLCLPAGAAPQTDDLIEADNANTARFGGYDNRTYFDMVRSGGVVNSGCLPDAKGRVNIRSIGSVEVMTVYLTGLPPNTNFDFFVLQVPNFPFGLSWYQGDIETNRYGRAYQVFVGRFNEETFIVAPDSAPAPLVHSNTFPDATSNPATGPVHTFHLGMWFNSPDDAVKAGCPAAVTPFNGEHNAGIQVLNTSNFPNDQGPLRNVKP
ncbi:MAG TPA: hypothetical protein P5528_12340 [Steroidobacteraceae bacterium]|nr:hypothetical protein [Steroidobacteraceae bacterium]HRX90223.1 hypothetical protein [Steroidobacteraceae bacterium]